MKKAFLLSVMLIASVLVFTSCSKDDDKEPKFNYPLETLYGTWQGTEVKSKGVWIDITKYPYTSLAFSITFNSDKSYEGRGFFGNGSGTYKAEGDMIYTYINGKEYARYSIKSLSKNKAELTMSMEGSDESIEIRVGKK